MSLSKLLPFLMLLSILISCSDDEDVTMTPTPDPKPDPEPTTPMIMLTNNTEHGSILTDENGMSLYFFTKDAFENSNCNDGCLSTWPVYNIENLLVGSGLLASDFGTITRADGAVQTVYKEWPLYYFSDDNVAGDTKGDNANDVWFVAKPDYSIMLSNNQLIGNDGVNYNSIYEPGDEEVQYFVDDRGLTLYAFALDYFEQNNYTKEDFSNDAAWPLFNSDNSNFPSNLEASLFTTIDVHGSPQLTYKGWPLYYFGGDEMIRGSNKGVSVPRPGVWPIVSKDIATAGVAPCDTAEVSYAAVIDPIMKKSCAFSGCHAGATPSIGLDLSNYDAVKSIASNGKLVGVVSWASGFSPMPKNRDQLDQCSIDLISAWIEQGTMNN